jgi:protein-S-isoprenylcysteine O-methyltransferase Ste14
MSSSCVPGIAIGSVESIPASGGCPTRRSAIERGRTGWLVGAIWIAWFVLAGGAGSARTRPGDRVGDRGTRAWADAATVASLFAAIAAARSVPAATIRADPRRTAALGSALTFLGIALRRWAARTLGRFFTQSVAIRPGHQVVATGPYRYVRHPGYTGLLVSMVGLGLTLGNWLSIVLMVLGFFAAHLPRISVEEGVLETNLGEPYRTFEATRKRLIPGVW